MGVWESKKGSSGSSFDLERMDAKEDEFIRVERAETKAVEAKGNGNGAKEDYVVHRESIGEPDDYPSDKSTGSSSNCDSAEYLRQEEVIGSELG